MYDLRGWPVNEQNGLRAEKQPYLDSYGLIDEKLLEM